MPTGVLINGGAVLIGGIIGAVIGNKVPEKINKSLTNVFGLSAILMGISLMVQMKSLSAVIMAMIVGTLIGEVCNLESGLVKGLNKAESKIDFIDMDKDKINHLISMIVLFCFSGTGIFGALNSGLTGDNSILFAKTILDFFTAIIFGSMVGYALSFVAIPQIFIGGLLFYFAESIMPYLNDIMISDFKACGGLITLAVGLKISNIKTYNVINMLPALALVMPLSYLWNLIF